MRHRSRLVAALICGALAFPAGAAPALVDVTVSAMGLRSASGVILACLTDQPAQFPNCRDLRKIQHQSAPAGKTVELRFPGIAPGRYAIALLHDENGNGKVDRALGMMPTEGFGFSEDAPVRMGPPKFEAAAFTVAAQPVHQVIHMRYLF